MWRIRWIYSTLDFNVWNTVIPFCAIFILLSIYNNKRCFHLFDRKTDITLLRRRYVMRVGIFIYNSNSC
jgi:hypothetical protein